MHTFFLLFTPESTGAQMQEHRRLAAIMFTDMVGFSSLTHRNEALALEVLKEHWRIIRAVFPLFGGKEIRSMGDGVFLEFASALDAAHCAIRIQQTLQDHNSGVEPERQILVRIGIHLGDVVETAGNVNGDGVNIAARIEPLAAPGGICVSEDVARQIQNKIDLPVQKLGLGDLKNISLPVTIFRIILPWEKKLSLELLSFPFRRRKVQVWVAITGIASIIVVGVFLIRLFSSPSSSNIQRLGILRFQSLTPESTSHLSPMLQSLFVEQFIGVEGLGVVDPLSLNNLIDSSRPQHDEELLRAVSAAQVSLVIDGSISTSPGGGYNIQAKLLDPSTGTISLTQSETIAGESELPHAVSAISSSILGFLQLRLLPGGKDKDLRPWIAHKSVNIEAVNAFIQASQFIYRGEPGEEKYLRRAIELDSMFIPARIWLISGMVRRGQLQEANEQYRFLQSVESTANPFDATMIEWAHAYITGDVPAQARALLRALEFSPGNNILLYNLGRVRFILEDYRGAIEAVTQTIAMKWPMSATYYLAAECHYWLGEYDAAKHVLESSLTVQPVYMNVYGLLSLLSLNGEDSAEALRYEDLFYHRSVELGSSQEDASALLGSLSASHGFHLNAVRLYKRAVATRPSVPSFQQRLGQALAQTGDYPGAIEACRHAVQLDSTLSDAQLVLALALDKTRDTTLAIRHYKQFLLLDSTSSDADLARRQLELLLPTH